MWKRNNTPERSYLTIVLVSVWKGPIDESTRGNLKCSSYFICGRDPNSGLHERPMGQSAGAGFRAVGPMRAPHISCIAVWHGFVAFTLDGCEHRGRFTPLASGSEEAMEGRGEEARSGLVVEDADGRSQNSMPAYHTTTTSRLRSRFKARRDHGDVLIRHYHVCPRTEWYKALNAGG
jgi:hypothetical protein